MAFLDRLKDTLFGQPEARAKVNHDLGLKELSKGRQSVAQFHFKAAAALAPGNGVYRLAHGNGLMMSGDFEGAIAEYEAASQCGLESEVVHSNWGVVLRIVGRTEEALVQHERALALAPEKTSTLANAAVCYVDLGRVGDATSLWQKILSIDPDDADAHFNLATHFDLRGDEAGFMEHVRKAALNEFHCAPVKLVQVRWYLERGDSLLAVAGLLEALGAQPDLVEKIESDETYASVRGLEDYRQFIATLPRAMFACSGEGTSTAKNLDVQAGEQHPIVILSFARHRAEARHLANSAATTAGWQPFTLHSVAPTEKKALVGMGSAVSEGWGRAEKEGAHIFVF